MEFRMTELRPKRSDSMPRIGEKKKDVTPQTSEKDVVHKTAVEVSPPTIDFTRHRNHDPERDHVHQRGDEDEAEGGLALGRRHVADLRRVVQRCRRL